MDDPVPKRRVLVVEDHPLIRRLVSDLLGECPGVEVSAAVASAEEGLTVLDGGAYDLHVVDVSLPGMNGIEFVRRVQTRDPAAACLMLSAHAQPVYAAEARKAGARGYVLKDDPDALLEAVRVVLDGGTFF
ncbi:MAG TPA: response regulator transcription factor [Rubricoccaceae bacterium]|nr:response regulator transcription factor [Rubricoccaceae bacterium]